MSCETLVVPFCARRVGEERSARVKRLLCLARSRVALMTDDTPPYRFVTNRATNGTRRHRHHPVRSRNAVRSADKRPGDSHMLIQIKQLMTRKRKHKNKQCARVDDTNLRTAMIGDATMEDGICDARPQ